MTQLQYSPPPVNSPHTKASPHGSSVLRAVPAPARGGSGTEGGRSVVAPFLYQNSNNCPENVVDVPQYPLHAVLSRLNQFSPYHQKQAFCIKENCTKFIEMIGHNRTGFLTLTFADNVEDNKEASRRYGSLRKHFLSEYYGEWMLVKERQSRGAWHYHVLIDCLQDIRTGFDFELHSKISFLRDSKNGGWRKNKAAIKPLERSYYLKSPLALRRLWAINDNVKNYGFGRPDLYPLEKVEDAISAYMSKYLSKHIESRQERDKGVRLTAYSQSFPRSTPKFQWNGDGSKEWRRKVAEFARIVGVKDVDGLSVKYGAKWAFHLGTLIDCIDGLSPSSVPDMVRSFLSRAAPWTPHPELIRRSDQVNDTLLDGDSLYLKSPDFRKTGQVYELF